MRLHCLQLAIYHKFLKECISILQRSSLCAQWVIGYCQTATLSDDWSWRQYKLMIVEVTSDKGIHKFKQHSYSQTHDKLGPCACVAIVAALSREMTAIFLPCVIPSYLWWGLIYLCIIKFGLLHSCNSILQYTVTWYNAHSRICHCL